MLYVEAEVPFSLVVHQNYITLFQNISINSEQKTPSFYMYNFRVRGIII